MAKTIGITLLLLSLIKTPLFSEGRFFIGIDALMADGLFSSGQRLSAEFSMDVLDVRVSTPVTYAFDLDADMAFLDMGVRLDCYPFEGLGLFFGADMLRYGRFFGRMAPEKKDALISSIVIGYTFEFPYSFLEPRLVVMDPGRFSEDVMQKLSPSFPMYSDFYFAFFGGVRF